MRGYAADVRRHGPCRAKHESGEAKRVETRHEDPSRSGEHRVVFLLPDPEPEPALAGHR